MAAWTQEQKDDVIKMYKDANPTPETSPEIIKEIADSIDQTANGVRMILITAGVYVKKDPATSTSKASTSTKTEGTKRVSKEAQIASLTKLLEDNNATVDAEILDKLTGKAAAYLVTAIEQVIKNVQ